MPIILELNVFFSLSVGISSILFETRLGCLQEEIPTETLRFIAAANNMLTLSETILFFPRWTWKIFPFWKQFIQAWDDLYDVGMLDDVSEQKESFVFCIYTHIYLNWLAVLESWFKTLISSLSDIYQMFTQDLKPAMT